MAEVLRGKLPSKMESCNQTHRSQSRPVWIFSREDWRALRNFPIRHYILYSPYMSHLMTQALTFPCFSTLLSVSSCEVPDMTHDENIDQFFFRITYSWQPHWRIWRPAWRRRCWPCIRSGRLGCAWYLWCPGTLLRPAALLRGGGGERGIKRGRRKGGGRETRLMFQLKFESDKKFLSMSTLTFPGDFQFQWRWKWLGEKIWAYFMQTHFNRMYP